ncbi:MAG: D-alanine--D-alanine ligase [Treponema sp.]|nr:D-alanine--D-alanine ligase [Treponema sp.]
MKKIGIICGGKSAEHEVSLQSARNIFEALNREIYEPILIGIDKNGQWHLNDAPWLLEQSEQYTGDLVTLIPQHAGTLIQPKTFKDEQTVDVIFPILHGPFGEDGTVQGLLKLADIPFVGTSVLGSAISMDKDVMKRLLHEADIPIGKFFVLYAHQRIPSFSDTVEKLALPFFVKPANMGSSVGVSKVHEEREYLSAVSKALCYDSKVLLEECIVGREIECAILGNEAPQASLPGEILCSHEFYSYEAKYRDEHGAVLAIPADLDASTVTAVQELALKTFQTLCCEGLARVDFFIKPDGAIIVNEINTMPGFTTMSMYPKLWEASGISYSDLIHRLINLAIERYTREKTLKTSYES